MRFRHIRRFVWIIVYLKKLNRFWGTIRGVFIDVRMDELVFARVYRIGRTISNQHIRFPTTSLARLKRIPKTFAIEWHIQFRRNIQCLDQCWE